MPAIRQKITPFLWFKDEAEEAARFYTSLFDDSRVLNVARYTAANPDREGSVMLVTFELAGQRFYALNGVPNDPFNESVSLMVECETQDEVDTLWGRLTEGGAEAPCGWLKDRYGLAWQITPRRLPLPLRSAETVAPGPTPAVAFGRDLAKPEAPARRRVGLMGTQGGPS